MKLNFLRLLKCWYIHLFYTGVPKISWPDQKSFCLWRTRTNFHESWAVNVQAERSELLGELVRNAWRLDRKFFDTPVYVDSNVQQMFQTEDLANVVVSTLLLFSSFQIVSFRFWQSCVLLLLLLFDFDSFISVAVVMVVVLLLLLLVCSSVVAWMSQWKWSNVT